MTLGMAQSVNPHSTVLLPDHLFMPMVGKLLHYFAGRYVELFKSIVWLNYDGQSR
jgi:hypothetical protein